MARKVCIQESDVESEYSIAGSIATWQPSAKRTRTPFSLRLK